MYCSCCFKLADNTAIKNMQSAQHDCNAGSVYMQPSPNGYAHTNPLKMLSHIMLRLVHRCYHS